MDKRKNKAAHKVRELTSHLEEEDLWDLEDSWDDEESEPSADADEETEEAPEEKTEVADPVEEKAETPDLFENASEEVAGTSDEELQETEEDQPDATKELEQEEVTDEDGSEKVHEVEPDSEEPVAQDTFDDPELTPEEAAKQSAAELIKKAGLSTAEKIALAAFALMFAGLAIWGYVFLHAQNNLGKTEAGLKLPIKGDYATISGFNTFWQAAGDSTGVRLGAQVVPAASITLSDESSGSGAFRVYFRNADKNSVGDPITIPFEDGKFSNGEKSIKVSASDGFHQEGDFNAYVLDRALAWRVQLLEAGSATASGSDFEEVLETIVEPVRK